MSAVSWPLPRQISHASKFMMRSSSVALSTICLPCRTRLLDQQPSHNLKTKLLSQSKPFSTASRWHEKHSHPLLSTKDNTSTPSDPTVHRVADDLLPSHRLTQQWTLSKRMHALMDKTMASLTLASQRINNYTGTDYSAIEALRREITEQEQLVKARYAAVQASKTALDEAQEMRTTSATELVALLERKHSWTASDLEKYMSLVRSEHANDRAVQTAKDAVLAAEQSLEESRIRLEKRERAQYHEEQIWSDTIRRNSTWVTMGLMGLNIGILLFNLVVIEPWRRRRLVVEVRKALAEKNLASPALVEQVRKGVLHDLEEQPNSVEENVEVPTVDLIVPEIFVAVSPVETMETVAMVEAIETVEAVETVESTKSELLSSWNNRAEAYIRSLFSDNLVSLRKIDMTTIVLQSAAAGASLAGLIIVVIAKPR